MTAIIVAFLTFTARTIHPQSFTINRRARDANVWYQRIWIPL